MEIEREESNTVRIVIQQCRKKIILTLNVTHKKKLSATLSSGLKTETSKLASITQTRCPSTLQSRTHQNKGKKKNRAEADFTFPETQRNGIERKL